MTDARNHVALEYVSTHTRTYMITSLKPVGRLRRVAMAAQTAMLAKAGNDAAEALSAAGPELTQAEFAAAAAKERRGDRAATPCPATTWRLR